MACQTNVQTKSGPVQVEFIDDSTPTPVTVATITRDDQLEDASFNVQRGYFGERNQSSAFPVNYRNTGVEAILQLSLANMTLDNLVLAFDGVLVVDGVTPTDRKLTVGDDAGKRPTRYKVVVKPYDGETVTTDEECWITMPCGQIQTDNTNIAFGLETQSAANFSVYALPGATGERFFYGVESAQP